MIRTAWADGLATVRGGDTLDVFYPRPELGAAPQGAPSDPELVGLEIEAPLRGVSTHVIRIVVADLDAPPADVADAYLRLHLLSHRLVRPNEVNLDGIFAVLPNVAWTSIGPVHPGDL